MGKLQELSFTPSNTTFTVDISEISPYLSLSLSLSLSEPVFCLLRMIKSLSPKVVTLAEQESNTNTTAFFQRFVETLEYYLAMFESIDVTLPRNSKERINVKQHCLARDIVNVIACEGKGAS